MESIQEKTQRVSDEASRRFWKAAQEREDKLSMLAFGTVFDVEDKQRVEAREALINPNDGQALERILGTSDLVGVNYLEIGLNAAHAVCRIRSAKRGAGCVRPSPGPHRPRGG